jgi:hypothetical protein
MRSLGTLKFSARKVNRSKTHKTIKESSMEIQKERENILNEYNPSLDITSEDSSQKWA